MVARKYSASMDDDLLDQVTAAAAGEGITVSAWLAHAAEDRLALEGLARLVADWQDEHGAFTEEERVAARTRLDAAGVADLRRSDRGGTRPRRRSA